MLRARSNGGYRKSQRLDRLFRAKNTDSQLDDEAITVAASR
jgi:hypothetical protein